MGKNHNITQHEEEIAQASYDFCIKVSNHLSIFLNPTLTYDHLQLAYQKAAVWEMEHILKLIEFHIEGKENLLKLEQTSNREYIQGMKDLLKFLQKRLHVPREKVRKS